MKFYMCKILVLVQCTNADQWVDIQNEFYKFCVLTNTNEDIHTILYYPSTSIPQGEFRESGNFLYYGIDEKLEWDSGNDPRNERFITALDYVVNHHQFDILYRGGGTSYLDYKKMYTYLCRIKCDKLYCGLLNGGYGDFDSNFKLNNYPKVKDESTLIHFVSGFHVIMSYDTCKVLAENRDLFLRYKGAEDVITGQVLVHDLKYIDFDKQPSNTTHYWLYDKDGRKSLDGLLDLNKNSLIFNYKIHSTDSTCMKDVYNILYNHDSNKRS